jgi:hypothetical protein
MTVTRDQAQILATLAVACRPYRAPTWDHTGVVAAIAGVKHLSLAEVVLAVIRAAADRDAQTPGVIPKLTGSHWQERLKPGLYEPRIWDPNATCTVCSLAEALCRAQPRVADDDHTFVSRSANAAATARPSEAVTRIVDDLREQTTHAAPTRAALTPDLGTTDAPMVAHEEEL